MAIVLILSLTTAVTVIVAVVVLKSCRRNDTTGAQKNVHRGSVASSGANNEAMQQNLHRVPGVIHTSSNEAYDAVMKTRETTTDYEAVSDPHTVPPSTTHSSQPTTGVYEQV